MEYVNVKYTDSSGKESYTSIQRASIICPFCKVQMIPEYFFLCENNEHGLSVFCQCSNPKCNHAFISDFVYWRNEYVFGKIAHIIQDTNDMSFNSFNFWLLFPFFGACDSLILQIYSPNLILILFWGIGWSLKRPTS